MKHFILIWLTVFSLTISAQTLTQSNHAPHLGSPDYTVYVLDSASYYPGAEGSNKVWNFNATTSTVVTNYSISNYASATFSPANIEVKGGNNNSAYYLPSSSDLKYYGGDMTVGGNNLTIKYVNPAILANYPFSFGNSVSSITSGSVSSTNPFPITQAFSGTCTATAVGTGTLILTSRTFNDVIKMKTVQKLVAGSSIGGINFTIVNYDYYSISSSRNPIFSIQTLTLSSGFGNTYQKAVTVQKDYDIVGINEQKNNQIALTVYPNPCNEFIQFSSTKFENFKITIFDNSGKLMTDHWMEKGQAIVKTSNLSTGIYLYIIENARLEIIKSGNFSVQKLN